MRKLQWCRRRTRDPLTPPPPPYTPQTCFTLYAKHEIRSKVSLSRYSGCREPGHDVCAYSLLLLITIWGNYMWLVIATIGERKLGKVYRLIPLLILCKSSSERYNCFGFKPGKFDRWRCSTWKFAHCSRLLDTYKNVNLCKYSCQMSLTDVQSRLFFQTCQKLLTCTRNKHMHDCFNELEPPPTTTTNKQTNKQRELARARGFFV